MIEITGAANLMMNSLLVNNLVVNTPKLNDYNTFNSFVSDTLITDLEDYAEISDEAYKLTLLEDIKIPVSPTAAYNNNFSNMLINYLNRDLDFNFV